MRKIGPALALFVFFVANNACAQSRSSNNPSIKTFVSPDGVFQVDYSSSLVLCRENSDEPSMWEPQDSCEGYIPLCSNGGINQPKILVCIGYRAGEAEEKTTFGGASFTVADLGEKNDQASCLAMPGAPSSPEKWKVKTIHNVKFFVTETTGAALGHWDTVKVFRILHDGRCYDLATTITGIDGQDTDPPTKSFDKASVKKAINVPVSTFKFLK